MNFEDISKLTTSQAKHGIRVHPRVPVSNSCLVPSSCSIIFESYVDLCKLLGVACMEDITSTLVKIKIDRRDNAPVSVRVIVGLRSEHSRSERLMVLAIGSSIEEAGKVTIP